MKLLDVEHGYFIKSIIAFSERCTLKKIELESNDIKVINRYRVDRDVREFIKGSIVSFTEAEIDSWYNKLKVYTNVSEQVKAEHVSDVMRYK